VKSPGRAGHFTLGGQIRHYSGVKKTLGRVFASVANLIFKNYNRIASTQHRFAMTHFLTFYEIIIIFNDGLIKRAYKKNKIIKQ